MIRKSVQETLSPKNAYRKDFCRVLINFSKQILYISIVNSPDVYKPFIVSIKLIQSPIFFFWVISQLSHRKRSPFIWIKGILKRSSFFEDSKIIPSEFITQPNHIRIDFGELFFKKIFYLLFDFFFQIFWDCHLTLAFIKNFVPFYRILFFLLPEIQVLFLKIQRQ